MPTITVLKRDGEEHRLDVLAGVSVMEAIRDAGIDEVAALCGGSCSCATCHVFVEEGADALGAAGEDEADMLEGSLYRRPNSRLSCQILVTDALEGVRVKIAPEE